MDKLLVLVLRENGGCDTLFSGPMPYDAKRLKNGSTMWRPNPNASARMKKAWRTRRKRIEAELANQSKSKPRPQDAKN